MSRMGKCTNYAGCLLAYRGEQTSVPADQPFVCAECGKPLSEVKGSAKNLLVYAAIGLLILVLAAGAVVALRSTKSKKAAATAMAGDSATKESGHNATGRLKFDATEAPTEPNPDSKGEAEPPLQVVAATKVNLSIDPKVKAEVLKRIDLMPGLSSIEKDKLYNSVERARKMGLVITIPFGKGGTTMAPGDVLAMKDSFAMPEIAGLLGDPLATLVVLGYADPKGDAKANLKYSKDRADAVASLIKKEMGDRNLIRSVAMGGSTLLDEKSLEKNRIAEVWIVLP